MSMMQRIKRIRGGMREALGSPAPMNSIDLAQLVGKKITLDHDGVPAGYITETGRQAVLTYLHVQKLCLPPLLDRPNGALKWTWLERNENGTSLAKRYAGYVAAWNKYSQLPSSANQPQAHHLATLGQICSRYVSKGEKEIVYCTVRQGDLAEICSAYGHPGGSCWGGDTIKWFMKNNGYALVFGSEWPVSRENGFARCWALPLPGGGFCCFNGYKTGGGYLSEVGELVKRAFPHCESDELHVYQENGESFPGRAIIFAPPAEMALLKAKSKDRGSYRTLEILSPFKYKRY